MFAIKDRNRSDRYCHPAPIYNSPPCDIPYWSWLFVCSRRTICGIAASSVPGNTTFRLVHRRLFLSERPLLAGFCPSV